MLCSRMLQRKVKDGHTAHGWFYEKTEPFFARLNAIYAGALSGALLLRWGVLAAALLFASGGLFLFPLLQRQLTPGEHPGIVQAQFLLAAGAPLPYHGSLRLEP